MGTWRSGFWYFSVRMLCSRSASLISTTRMSLAMARNILRRVSAWASSRLAKFSWLSLVTPSTSRATSSPNCSRTTSSVQPSTSSTQSCSRPAAMVVASSIRSVRITATATGWLK